MTKQCVIVSFVLIFQLESLTAQPFIPIKQIDSVFDSHRPSDKDWAISLSIQQGGTVPIYDSAGNNIYAFTGGTILFINIGGEYFYQKLTDTFVGERFERNIIIGKRYHLPDRFIMKYSVDSLALGVNESIYPYLYRDDRLNTYDVQPPSPHAALYGLYFKTSKDDGYTRYFADIALKESLPFLGFKNLNYEYNSRTFISRVFFKISNLIENLKP